MAKKGASKKPSQKELRKFLGSSLPDYMIPSAFISLDYLPLITSGKLDRKALLEREDTLQGPSEEKYFPPETDIEKKLAKVWEKVLRARQVGRENNFFSLGGDSLNIIRILQLVDEYGFDLKFEDFYVCQTVSGLADLIVRKKNNKTLESSLGAYTVEANSHNSDNRYPLSSIQKRYWHKLEGARLSRIILINSLFGNLNIPVFSDCLEEILNRHLILKAKFIEQGQAVFQSVSDEKFKIMRVTDFQNYPKSKLEDAIVLAINKICRNPIDLYHGPLIRVDLLKISIKEYYFVLVVSHLVFDGISSAIFIKELKELYTAKIKKRRPILPPLPVQYGDYAVWEESNEHGDFFKNRSRYWNKHLSNIPPFKFSAGLKGKNTKNIFMAHLKKTLVKKLKKFSRVNKITLNSTFIFALSILLYRWTGEVDVVIKNTISLRPRRAENLIGLFVNGLPIRINQLDRSSHREILDQVRHKIRDGYANLLSTDQITRSLESERDRNALNDWPVIFNFISGHHKLLQLDGVKSEVIEFEETLMPFNGLYLEVTDSGENLDYFFWYHPSLFTQKAISNLVKRFEEVLIEITSSQNLSLDRS